MDLIAAQQEVEVERDLKNPDNVEGYLMTTMMIKEAWARYRPVQRKGKNEKKQKIVTLGQLRNVFPDNFIDRMIANTKIKIYDFKDTEPQNKRKKKYKADFIRHYKDKVKLWNSKNGEEDPEDFMKGIDQEEIDMIDMFLLGLCEPNDGKAVEQIDIKLALKSLPSHVDEMNMHRCLMFNYKATKQALIGYQNDD